MSEIFDIQLMYGAYITILVLEFVSRIFEILFEIVGIVIPYSNNNHHEIFYIFVGVNNTCE